MPKILTTQFYNPSLETHILTEIKGLRPSTARVAALAIITNIMGKRKLVKQASNVEEKIDALSDLVVTNSYLTLLAVAMDNVDRGLLAKLKMK